MAEIRVHAEVRLWGRTLGGVVELDSGRIVFEYADDFRHAGLEPSPVKLPVSRRGPVSFEALADKPAFNGLPGLLADALPDAFGNRVIRAYFAARGREQLALSPVQRLLYVGERAIGALTFHPAEELPTRPAELQSLEIAALVADARRIIAGRPEVALPEIYRIGASAGGMRPKAVVLYHPATGDIRSAYAAPHPGDVPAIIKFDGVGDGTGPSADTLGRPQPYNRVEAAYASMARAAGIDMAGLSLLESGDHAHLLVRRFDFDGATRLHQHSFGGMIHLDYHEPGASSYEEYLRTILRLGLAQASIVEGFRRMVFNVLAVNQDDHVKNLSFHMGPDGRWRLTPAYDVTFAHGSGFTARHQMRVRDKTAGITMKDLLAVADLFDIRAPDHIIERTRAALAGWNDAAATSGVPSDTACAIGREIDQRWSALGDR